MELPLLGQHALRALPHAILVRWPHYNSYAKCFPPTQDQSGLLWWVAASCVGLSATTFCAILAGHRLLPDRLQERKASSRADLESYSSLGS